MEPDHEHSDERFTCANTVLASDADIPANTLTFSLASAPAWIVEPAPTGSCFFRLQEA